MKKAGIFTLVFFLCGLLIAATNQKIYWGDSVPKGWNGS